MYKPLVTRCTLASDFTIRYGEPAGSRVMPSHSQLDLNYSQSFHINRYRVQIVGDLYNVANKQTGYNYNPSKLSAGFGLPLSHWAPRLFQLTAKIGF